jgi:hypothetical protein
MTEEPRAWKARTRGSEAEVDGAIYPSTVTNSGPFMKSTGKHSIYPPEGTGYRNGPFISLKNGSFKEPLLSLHFACALGIRCPEAVSLLQEREGATHYETANG